MQSADHILKSAFAGYTGLKPDPLPQEPATVPEGPPGGWGPGGPPGMGAAGVACAL